MSELLVGTETKPDDLNPKDLVVYSDGGSLPGNGFTGWGCFSEVKTDKDIYHVMKYGGIKAPSTNQAAELKGAIEAFSLAKDLKPKTFKLKSDSKYVIDGITKYYKRWVENGYLNSQGKPIANRELWKELNNATKSVINDGISYKLEWVKGHSGVIGNEWADKLATMGVACSSRGEVKGHTIRYTKEARDDGIEEVGTKKQPKRKFDYNRLHIHDFLYFKLGDSFEKGEDGRYTYYSGKAAGLDDLGVLSAECRLGVIKLNEPLPLIKEVAGIHNHMDADKWGLVTQVITRNLFQKAVAFDIIDYGVDVVNRAGLTWTMKKDKPTDKGPVKGKGDWREKDDLFYKDKQLTYVCNPPKNSVKLIEQIATLEKLLEKFIKDRFENNAHIHVDDITDVMYDTIPPKNSKGVEKYKVAQVMQPPAINYTHKITIGKQTYKTKLRLGIDFLTRNELSGFMKGTKTKPRVYMVYVTQSATANWYTIVEKDGEFGIYSAQCSNLIIL